MDQITQIVQTMTNGSCQGSHISENDEKSLEEQIVEISNRKPGNLTGYNCKKCLNRGHFWVYRDGYRFVQDCECMDVRRSLKQIENSGLKDLLENHTFAGFACKEPWQTDAKSRVLQFIADRERQWLILSGQPGCGKTHLCTAAAGRFLKAGIGVRYMRWVDDGTPIKACVNDAEAYARLVDPLKRCKVLYIDDLFKRKSDQQDKADRGDIRLAFDILDHRYVNRLTTIISTERTLDDLLRIDEGIGSRIYERTKGYQLVFDYDKRKNFRVYGDG